MRNDESKMGLRLLWPRWNNHRLIVTILILAWSLFYLPSVIADTSCKVPTQLESWDYNSTKAINRGKDWRNSSVKTDYWMLSLSWSKAYCDKFTFGNIPKDAQHQCRDNDFGLVVHGLWAQSRQAGKNHKAHPRNCRDTVAVPVKVLREHICQVPGIKLMQKEWEKHGSCDFSSPADYFGQTDMLYRQLKLPSREELLGLEYGSWKKVKQKILELNRDIGLRSEHLFVEFKKKRLREVRVCYDLRYKFTACN